MKKTKFITKAQRLLSGFVATAIAASMLSTLPAMAEETTEKYPYTLFAGSSEEGAITVNSGNFCVNGNVATNGTIVTSGNMNINGTRTESAKESMIFIFDKIDNQYFSASNVEEHAEDYTLDELNININVPTEVQGKATLTGNININNALKALENVNLYGEVKNTNDSVIFSKYGDIIIDSQNVNLNGLVYAPFGSVNITAQNLNLNNVIIIADSIVLTCPNVNANNSSSVSAFVGTNSDQLDIPYDEWQYMKDENENSCPDFFEDPTNWKLFSDTDGDDIPDPIEIVLDSDINNVDTDSDGLNDYYEVFVLLTNPTVVDTDDNGTSDYDEDLDNDDLSNGEEYHIGTEPEMKDTDKDELSDGDEVNIYFTDPLIFDTDLDDISDGDEVLLNTDPKEVTENTKNSFTKTFTPADFGYDADKFIPNVEFTSDAKGILTFKMEYRYSDLTFNPVTPGYIANSMNFSTEGEFGSATLKYYIPDELLNSEDFEPAIYYFNEEKHCLEELTNATLNGNIISVELEHFSSYAVLNKKAFDHKFKDKGEMINYLPISDDVLSTQKTDADVVFVLDDSGSMSSNDALNMRKSATSKFISSLPETDSVGIISFTSEEPKCLLPITNADSAGKSKANNALNNLKNNGNTDGSWGLHEGIELLNSGNEDNIKCMIFLTDGADNRYKYSYNDIIETAQNKGITIFTIGLKNYTNEKLLDHVATQTGGKFFEIDNLSELGKCYEEIRNLTIDYITDSNNDGISDYFTWKLCSGQMTDGYGNTVYPFGNPYDCSEANIDYTTIKNNEDFINVFKKTSEAIYDRVQKNADYDEDNVDNGDEIKILNSNRRYYAYVSSDPNCSDTDADGINDYDEIYVHETKPNKFSAVCNFNQYYPLTYDDYYIASIYKDQVLNGNIINNLGLAISKLYSKNCKHDLYVKEVSNMLTKLYESYNNQEYQDALTILTLNDAKNYLVYLRTIYAADFDANINKALNAKVTIGFNINEYTKAQLAFIENKKAENGLKYCVGTEQFREWCKEYHEITDLKQFNVLAPPKNLGQAVWKDATDSLSEAFKGTKNKVLRVGDFLMVAAGTALEAGSTYDYYTDLQNSANFFNDSEEVLTRIQNRTKNSTLYNVLDEIIPALKDDKELKRQQIQQTISNGTEEFLYEAAHTAVSWCGSVGATIEAAIALGTLTGIPETAQYTYQTCCAASMADCLAAEWEDDITTKMLRNSNGDYYVNEDYCNVSPFDIINYQRYVITMRLEETDNFISMEEAGIIKSLKHLLNKENIKDAEQTKKELSYEYMKKPHYFIDARIYV